MTEQLSDNVDKLENGLKPDESEGLLSAELQADLTLGQIKLAQRMFDTVQAIALVNDRLSPNQLVNPPVNREHLEAIRADIAEVYVSTRAAAVAIVEKRKVSLG